MSISSQNTSLFQVKPMSVATGVATQMELREAFQDKPEIIAPIMHNLFYKENRSVIQMLIDQYGSTDEVTNSDFTAYVDVKPWLNFPIVFSKVGGSFGDNRITVQIGTDKRDLIKRGTSVSVQDPVSRTRYQLMATDDGFPQGSHYVFTFVATSVAGSAVPAGLTRAIAVGERFYRSFHESDEFGQNGGMIHYRNYPIPMQMKTSIITGEMPVTRRYAKTQRVGIEVYHPQTGKKVITYGIDSTEWEMYCNHSLMFENFAMEGTGGQRIQAMNSGGSSIGGQPGLIDQMGAVNRVRKDVLDMDFLQGLTADLAHEINGHGGDAHFAIIGSKTRSNQFSNLFTNEAQKWNGLGERRNIIGGALDDLSYSGYFKSADLNNGLKVTFINSSYFDNRTSARYGDNRLMILPIEVSGQKSNILKRVNFKDSADIKFQVDGSIDSKGSVKGAFSQSASTHVDGMTLFQKSDSAVYCGMPQACAVID